MNMEELEAAAQQAGEDAANAVQVIRGTAFVCSDGDVLVALQPPNETLGYNDQGLAADLQHLVDKTGAAPLTRATYEFWPHAPVILRQLDGPLNAQVTHRVAVEMLEALERVVGEAVCAALTSADQHQTIPA